MKITTLILTAIFVFTIATLKSQDSPSKLSIGAGGGIGLSWFKSKNAEFRNNGVSPSYNYALNVDYNFAKNYTFRSGLGMRYLGGKLAYDSTEAIEIERKYRLQYLEIPLHLVLKTNQIGYLTYSVNFGLNNQFRITSMGEEEFTDGTQTHITEGIDFKETVRFYNLGFRFGFGVDYEISNSFAAFGVLSYDTGLTNTLSGTYILDPNQKENAILNNFGLTLGFVF